MWTVPEKARGILDLQSILRYLGRQGVVNVLIEGGNRVVTSALSQNVVDECFFFVAPMILGGARRLSRARRFRRAGWTEIGGDLLLHGTF